MIEEVYCGKKLSRKMAKLGYLGENKGGDISISCALKWLRVRWRIGIVPLPYHYPVTWLVWHVYLGEPKEKDDKLDMCELGKSFVTYEEAALFGIRHGIKIVEKIYKILNGYEQDKDGGKENAKE